MTELVFSSPGRRAATIFSLALIVLLAWVYTIVAGGWVMPDPAAPDVRLAWTASHVVLMLLMWWVMMVAMMVPSVTPMFLLVTSLNRHRGLGVASNAAFLCGYLIAWGGFSVLATGLQWGLDTLRLLSPMMAVGSNLLGSFILLVAGLYQFSGRKRDCLEHCRAPVEFLARRSRLGLSGMTMLGFEHGLYCLGCCWALMALLFYGGVMSPIWIIGLTIYVALEKMLPLGHQISKIVGVLLILAAIGVLVSEVF